MTPEKRYILNELKRQKSLFKYNLKYKNMEKDKKEKLIIDIQNIHTSISIIEELTFED